MKIQDLYQLFLKHPLVTTDSRKIEQGSIFFALSGEHFNGNKFAVEALLKGASFAVIDEEVSDADSFSDRLILVKDSLVALQELAHFHRQQFQFPVLAITGSNGKTTTKELIAAILSKKYKTFATKGNLNNHIGVPLTLLSVPADAEFTVVEMGANHQGEIASYCQIATPDFGLITNIGKAHLEGFGGEVGVAKGKSELYDYLTLHKGKVFAYEDDEKISHYLPIHFPNKNDVIFYGKRDLQTESTSDEDAFLQLFLKNGNTISTHLVGEYNLPNVLAAIAVGLYFGVCEKDIYAAIENYEPTNNRSQMISKNSNQIILDAYNANPSSMREAILNFRKSTASKKIAILGQMMELGEYAQAEHQTIVDLCLASNFQLNVFVGEQFAFTKNLDNTLYFNDTDELKKWFSTQTFEHTLFLIKGSRKNGLEKILEP